MPSWQSYVVHPVLRFTVKRKLARSTTPLAARAAFNNPLPFPKNVKFSLETFGEVEGEWALSNDSSAGTLLYLHGGGYFACSPRTHRSITGAYALGGFSVFAPDYRLAPENPFPAAVEDALASYKAMLDRAPANRLAIGGDSAGGGLALATLLAAKSAGLPMPACILLFSPWTDLAATGDSVVTNARQDSMLYGPKIAEGAEIYLNGADPKNPLASPLYGDLRGLPPLLIQVAAPEVLLNDSTRLADRAREAGVTVDLSIWENLPHAWQVNQLFLPEAKQALDQALEFAKAALALKAADA
jgi:monoterpene epsilon-lactone hydrolase